ncbi:MAG: PDDEXK nuclease domain-containing protein [bacterium]|nr:PDDEXK nuclease domain-containing protein [bacterium]
MLRRNCVVEFLRLDDVHSEKELRKAILVNLRDFFLEFGKDLTFVGEEYPLKVGNDTFFIDLLFFHRRLQCLIAVDLKKGKFKPEHAGNGRRQPSSASTHRRRRTHRHCDVSNCAPPRTPDPTPTRTTSPTGVIAQRTQLGGIRYEVLHERCTIRKPCQRNIGACA